MEILLCKLASSVDNFCRDKAKGSMTAFLFQFFFSCGVGFGLYPSVSVDGKFVTMRCIFFSPPKEYPPPPVFCNAQGVKHLIPFDNWEKNVSTEPTRYF